MKFTLAWLKEHLDTSASLDEIAACLNRIAALKYGIPDPRAMFSCDLRWLRHYGFSVLDVPTVAGGLGG